MPKKKEKKSKGEIHLELLKLLKKNAPEVFTEGKINCEKLKEILDGEIQEKRERYGLSWAGKSDCFRQIQTPLTGKTLIPCREESINFDTSKNIFIEGENLQVLKLLQKSYHGKIKMIYIDPPYNTGNDSFVYPDRFKEKLEEYQKRAGIMDDEGNWLGDVPFQKNTRDNGHYHSNWLSMMYPRLFLARQLLRDDGVIFVSIDDNEVQNLRLIMDEIFGEENFICEFVREAIKGGSQSKFVRETHDYIITFAKNRETLEFAGFEKDEIELDLKDEKGPYAKGRELNKWGAGSRREDSPGMWFPIEGPNGENVYPIRNDRSEGRWRLGKAKMTKLVKEEEIIFEKRDNGTYVAYEKLRGNKSKYTQFITILKDKYLNAKASEDLKELFQRERAIFDFSKPSILLKDLLILANADDDIILDFFAGSGSMAQAVLELNKEDGGNRKFICNQMAEPCSENSEALKEGYSTIAEICKERIRRVIQKIEKESEGDLPSNSEDSKLDLGFKVFKLGESFIREWECEDSSPEMLTKQMELFTNRVKEGASEETLLYELMLGGEAELAAEVKEIVAGNKKWFLLDGGRLAVSVGGKITQKIIDSIVAAKPKKAILLDYAFDGDDDLKKNTVLQFHDASIKVEFV